MTDYAKRNDLKGSVEVWETYGQIQNVELFEVNSPTFYEIRSAIRSKLKDKNRQRVVTEKRDNSDRTDATQESPSAKAYKEAQESANSFTKSKVDSFTSTGRVSGGFAEGGLVKKRKPKKQVMKKKRGLATR